MANLCGLAPEKSTETPAAERELAGRIIERLVHIIATVSPGAKLGSTAPHAYAHCVIVEAGNAQPRTFANAFLKPVSERPDLFGNTYGALSQHISALDEMYGANTERCLAAIDPVDPLLQACGVDQAHSLAEVATWCAHKVQGE